MTKKVIKLTRGVPPAESFPVAQLKECATAVLEKYADVVLQYGPSRGFPLLRSAIAGDIDGVSDDQVIIGQG
ncbi:MAG TPA: PLP-dependent aminotransferase family protein, partial [Chloroflexi bacterium]|nr:PLP-dependent aminotransferase family protein [Chloroflexota bacterium]